VWPAPQLHLERNGAAAWGLLWDGGLARKGPLIILCAAAADPAPADIEGGINNVEIDPDP
jgi:hypothetical protein